MTTVKHVAGFALFALMLSSACEAEPAAAIGPQGGTILSDDGRFSLEIPPGALETHVRISIEAVDCEPSAAVGPCYRVTPSGVGFLLPATLTYELGGMELDVFDPARLNVIAKRDEGWNVLPDQEVDLEDETLTASALYLSAFAVVTQP